MFENEFIGDLHVEISGRGPPILLIHGFGASSITWSKIVPWLSSDYTIVLVDLRGFGKSKKPQDARYALRDQAAAILKVIDALGLDDLTIIGHSMGGGVALLVAMRLEQQKSKHLHRLVLIDSIAFPQRLPLFIAVLRLPLLGPLVLRVLPATWQVRYVLRRAYFNRDKIDPNFVEAYAAPLRSCQGRAALLATARAIIPPDSAQLIAEYGEIRTPVLLLWGRQDNIVQVSVARDLKKAIPIARYKELDECGHVPQEERPEDTLQILKEFLAYSEADGKHLLFKSVVD